MSKTIDEGLASALVKLAGKALKSSTARNIAGGAVVAARPNKPSVPSVPNTQGPAKAPTATNRKSQNEFDGFDFDKFAKHAAAFESGGRQYGKANYGSKTNFGYEGAFGTGSQALEQAGLLKPGATKKYSKNNSSQAAIYQPDAWADGYSREQYLKSPELQHKVYKTVTKFNYDYLKRKGVITPDMTPDEIAGRLYAAAHGGAGGAEKYFVHGKDTRDFKFKNATVGKSYQAMKQHFKTYGNDDSGQQVSESAVGALVKTAANALKSPSVRQSLRTAILGGGAVAAWKNTYGGSDKQRPNPSQQPTSRRSGPNDTWSRMVSTESGGRQFGPAGQTLTSRKGAIGAAQIMPQYGAEFARRAGVEWDERKARTDRDYNLKLGRAQFDHLLNTYKGDHARAAAAYNAGPGGLRRAERKARAAGRPDAWKEYLPQETKDYVRKVIREETSTHYMSKRDLINRVVDTYSVQPQEQASLQELFVQCVETLKESHAIILLRLFNDLSEENQEIMFDLVETEEGVRELLDFAIDKYMVQKD